MMMDFMSVLTQIQQEAVLDECVVCWPIPVAGQQVKVSIAEHIRYKRLHKTSSSGTNGFQLPAQPAPTHHIQHPHSDLEDRASARREAVLPFASCMTEIPLLHKVKEWNQRQAAVLTHQVLSQCLYEDVQQRIKAWKLFDKEIWEFRMIDMSCPPLVDTLLQLSCWLEQLNRMVTRLEFPACSGGHFESKPPPRFSIYFFI